MQDNAYFQVEGRITQLLGQNYSSVEHALKELVDNAWDADAEQVHITLPKALDTEVRYVEIVDDGIGMSADNVKKEYMRIARNRLIFGGDTTKKKGRKIKGRKGIGKFAGLLLANKMTVQTTQEERTTTFTVEKESFVEAEDNISEQKVPIEVVDSPDKKSGTTILLTELDLTCLSPDDSKLRQLLVLEYGREEEFEIYINGERLQVEDVGGTNYTYERDFGDNKIARLSFNITEKPVRNKQAGVVLRVNGKIIGEPHCWGVEDINYVQSKMLKKVYGEVNADYLLKYTQNSWGILEGTVDYRNLELFVREKISKALEEQFDYLIQHQKYLIEREIKDQINNLPEYKRERASRIMEKIIRGLSEGRHTQEQIRNIVSVAISAIEHDDYCTIIEKIAQATDAEVSIFAEVLQEFGLVDMSMIINQAIARRNFLDELQKLADNPKTLEVEMHTALENNMWVFGMSWSFMASNQTLKHIVKKYLDDKFKGKRANKRPDLLLKQDYTNRCLLIEFKRPIITIGREHEAQAARYRDDLRAKFHGESIAVIVVGKKVDSTILPNQTYMDCTLTSYDALIATARNQLNWLIDSLQQKLC